MPRRRECRDKRLRGSQGLARPRHEDRAAAFDDDDRLGIGLGDRRDERVLVAGQLEAAVRAFAVVLRDEDDGDVGSCRERRGRSRISARIERDLRARQLPLQRVERRRRQVGMIVDHHRAADRRHVGRAAAGKHALVGVAADHRDRT